MNGDPQSVRGNARRQAERGQARPLAAVVVVEQFQAVALQAHEVGTGHQPGVARAREIQRQAGQDCTQSHGDSPRIRVMGIVSATRTVVGNEGCFRVASGSGRMAG
ncbi:hypothetical protein P797_34700 [Pseudomonas aeruginosa VRFPA04]|nr:hypothetical protein P797_34700 [Pseudomonas aeruginosa VRFPA04]